MLLVSQCLSQSPWIDNRTPSKTLNFGTTMTQQSKSLSLNLVHSEENNKLLLKVTISILSISLMTLTMPMILSVCGEHLERPQLRSSHQQRPDAWVHKTPSHHHWLRLWCNWLWTTRMLLMVLNSFSSTHQVLLRPLLLEDQPMVVLKYISMVKSSITLENQSVSSVVSQSMLSSWARHIWCVFLHHTTSLERLPWSSSIGKINSMLELWSSFISSHQWLNQLSQLVDHLRDSPRSILLDRISVRTTVSDMLLASSTIHTHQMPLLSAMTPCTVTHLSLTYLIVIPVITTTAFR